MSSVQNQLLYFLWIYIYLSVKSGSEGQAINENKSVEDEIQEDFNRTSRDLVYEAMKMRTGNSKPRSPDDKIIVGGGIVEKKLQQISAEIINAEADIESREMQCCDDLMVKSYGGINDCHPYVLGEYRRIGQCGGRSFYQHKNNTDIFIYYVCGAWYVGLQVGVCGGWILAKSLEICVSSRHRTSWQYFNEGNLYQDDTFQVEEKCLFNNDYPERPIHPQHSNWLQSDVDNYPQHFAGNGQLTSVLQETIEEQPDFLPLFNPNSVKHEHIHYHYEQPKPPPFTSAKSNKYENLKKYQQQILNQKLGLGYDPVESPSYPEPGSPFQQHQTQSSMYPHQSQNPIFDYDFKNTYQDIFHDSDQLGSNVRNDTKVSAPISSQHYLDPPQKPETFIQNYPPHHSQSSYPGSMYTGLITKGSGLQRPLLSYQGSRPINFASDFDYVQSKPLNVVRSGQVNYAVKPQYYREENSEVEITEDNRTGLINNETDSLHPESEKILYFPFEEKTDVKSQTVSEGHEEIDTTTESIKKTIENSRNLN